MSYSLLPAPGPGSHPAASCPRASNARARTPTRIRSSALPRVFLLLLLVTPFFAACDVPGPPAANSRGADVAGDFEIALATQPNPATAGPVTIVVDVRDMQGRPVEGATVMIVSRMEGMGHGGMDGQFADKGGGRYDRAGGFSMPGPWLLTIETSKEGSMLSRKTFEVMVR